MKNLIAIVLFCSSIANATPCYTGAIVTDSGEKEKVDKKKEEEKSKENAKNLHSIKKWKMTIKYLDGSIISKTIVVSDNSKLSALETAFEEAEKHIKNRRKVKDFYVSPISNSYILLAGD